MKRLFVFFCLLVLLTGCGAGYSYPEGATAMERWQVDQYHKQQWDQALDSFNRSTQRTSRNCSYLNGMLHCW